MNITIGATHGSNQMIDVDQVRSALALFSQNGVYEIRILNAGKLGTISGYFDDIEHGIEALKNWQNMGVATYVTLNPVLPDLLARCYNRLSGYAKYTTNDKEVISRKWLLIDVDPDRPSGISSSNSELEVALERTKEIRSYLTTLNWPDPVYANSGNGGHLLYKINLPNNNESKELVSLLLKSIANKFNGDLVKIDQGVFNAARISKLYGTWAKKGDNIPARPHRMATILEKPTKLEVVDYDLLKKVADDYIETPIKPRSSITGTSDFWTNVNSIALDNLSAWVPAIFPQAKTYHGGYRITSKQLNRELEEDLSIVPEGIQDFGTEEKLTAIDVVKKWNGIDKPLEAAKWICERVGIDPKSIGYTDHSEEISQVVIDYGSLLKGKQQAVEEPVKYVALPTPPKTLLSPPGILQEIANWINTSSPKQQPYFAVQSALALASLVCGRYYTTNYNNYTSLFFVNLGPSASGKEFGRRAIEKILQESGYGSLIGPSGYHSDGAVFSALLEKPKHITLIDELGAWLRGALKEIGHHKRGAITQMVEVWGRCDGIHRPAGYSTATLKKQQTEELTRTIDRPALTLLALSTPKSFSDALSHEQIENGLINRLIIMPTFSGRQTMLDKVRVNPPIPQSVIDWVQTYAQLPATTGGNLENIIRPDDAPTPILIPIEAGAMKILEIYEKDCLARMATLEIERLDELEGRSVEKAMRLALICALACKATRISPSHAQWAIDYVSYTTEYTIQFCRNEIAINSSPQRQEFSETQSRVLDVVRGAKDKGATLRELCKSGPLRGMTPRDRDAVLKNLADLYEIVISSHTNKNGTITKIFFDPSYAPGVE